MHSLDMSTRVIIIIINDCQNLHDQLNSLNNLNACVGGQMSILGQSYCKGLNFSQGASGPHRIPRIFLS